jgi:5,10-methenyltetrahydromethanopterin hydrogenase
MDEVPTRNHAEAHAKAVVDGDMDTVTNDFVPEMRDGIGDVAQKLPQPTTDAEIERFEMEDDHAVVQIRYSNDDGSLTITTRWEEHDGRPMIVEVLGVEEGGPTLDT